MAPNMNMNTSLIDIPLPDTADIISKCNDVINQNVAQMTKNMKLPDKKKKTKKNSDQTERMNSDVDEGEGGVKDDTAATTDQ